LSACRSYDLEAFDAKHHDDGRAHIVLIVDHENAEHGFASQL
jgi:hypothetical protein